MQSNNFIFYKKIFILKTFNNVAFLKVIALAAPNAKNTYTEIILIQNL